MPEEEYLQMFGDTREAMIEKTKEEMRQAAKAKDWTLFRDLVAKLKKVYIGDDVFWANEVASNSLVMIVMGLLALILASTLIMSAAGYYEFRFGKNGYGLAFCVVQLVVGIILCLAYKGERRWLKYLMMFFLCATSAATFSLLGTRTMVMVLIPVVLSVRYFSKRFTKWVAILMGIFLLSSAISFVFIGVEVDISILHLSAGTVLPDTATPRDVLQALSISTKDYLMIYLERAFLPCLMQYIVTVVICLQVAKWGHNTIVTQAQVATEFSRMDTELNLAKEIQENILPNIFPAYPEKEEFEIFATMNAAKEVGGDFYDFFLIDDNHLCMVMADVSGKGVPAALFMMISKVMIKTQAMMGLSPSEILRTVNIQLCENNTVEMFVTCWVGILALDTGVMTAANAGHEYPAIMRMDPEDCEEEGYHLYKDKHGFVLGGLEMSRYKEYSLTLKPGDGVFFYTDGVTEAVNKHNELFGTDRMIKALNRSNGETQEELLSTVKNAIDRFVGDADQFDDITMLGMRYFGPMKKEDSETVS